MSKATHISVGGAPEGFDAALVLREVERGQAPVIHVARDDKRMAQMAPALRFFAPAMPVLTFPGWDCLPYDRASPNADISAAPIPSKRQPEDESLLKPRRELAS